MSASFSTAITIIAHTPIWVWPLYALLLFLGFQRTRDSSVPLWRMLTLPLVVTLFALVSFISAGPSGLPAILGGLVIGGAAGWCLEPRDASRRQAGGRIWLRGEWWTFAQIVLVLIFRYAANVMPVLDPALHANPVWNLGTLAISTTLSASFLGRTAARLRVYLHQRAPIGSST